MTKSTQTLTQSGLLAVLLQRQRYRVIQLARRRAHRKRVRAAFWSSFTRLVGRAHGTNAGRRFRQALCGNAFRATLESFTKPITMSHQIHTYTELKQQIHDDLRIQHPEWVEPNGESPMCDSYESRLMELLDTLTRRGSNDSIAAPQRALEQGTGT